MLAAQLLQNSHGQDANDFENIGLHYRDKGELGTALMYLERAFQIKKKAYSADSDKSLDVAATCNNLALVYRDQGNLSAATEYFDKALSIKLRCAGNNTDHWVEVATGYNNLGLI